MNIAELLAKAQAIKLLILDVDGVLTDGRLYFDNDGLEYKCFHARDGHGIKLLKQTGVELAIISGRKSQAVALRMQSLGISHVYQGHEHKLNAFESLLKELNLSAEQVAYMGDDVLDLPLMIRVGLAVAVQDAHIEVKQRAHWQTQNLGGHGAVRELCDFIMQAQATYHSALAQYLV